MQREGFSGPVLRNEGRRAQERGRGRYRQQLQEGGDPRPLPQPGHRGQDAQHVLPVGKHKVICLIALPGIAWILLSENRIRPVSV